MHSTARQGVVYLCGLLLLIVTVCEGAVQINEITVPSLYELKEEVEQLKLDCDFTVDEKEPGFVLKWLHNGVQIYQWIPSNKQPFVLGTAFKGRIDLNYVGSEDRLKKHSALVITKPLLTDSGNYTCYVQTLQSNARKTAEMLIIDPEDSMNVSFRFVPEDDSVDFKCEITNIFPLPEVTLLFNDKEVANSTIIDAKMGDDNVYDITAVANLKKNEVEDESNVVCLVKIPNTNYEKKAVVLYDDPKQSATTKKTILGELTKSAQSEAGATNESAGNALRCSIGVMLLSVVCLLLPSLH